MSQTATHLLNAMWLGTQSLYWLQEFQNNTEKNELINLNNPSENADSFSGTLFLWNITFPEPCSAIHERTGNRDMSTSVSIKGI